jgi:hypothetical protein
LRRVHRPRLRYTMASEIVGQVLAPGVTAPASALATDGLSRDRARRLLLCGDENRNVV